MLHKTLDRILIFYLLQGTGVLPVSSIYCQRSQCELEKNSEYDCLSRYLVSYLECGPQKRFCSKILLYNKTGKLPRIETKDGELMVGYPLLSVIRDCDPNEQKYPINECIMIPEASPPNSAAICLCNTDYCNGGTQTKLMPVPIFLGTVFATLGFQNMLKCF